MSWHAKVHKTGTKVAVYNGLKLVKVVETSKETFEPAEAQKFAEQLLVELEERTSSQMSSPSEAPSTTTTAELQNDSMAVATQQATGDTSSKQTLESEEKFSDENKELKETVASLKKKLATEMHERAVERKARRGLAIAKQMVIDGILDDSYDSIKSKVAQIVKLEDNEIDRLERKIAGEHEFESIEDAQKELRRQARIVRINRQAAAEAQDDKDEEQADSLDQKADAAEAKVSHIKQVIEEMKKTSDVNEPEETKEKEETEEEKADSLDPKSPVEENPNVLKDEEKKEVGAAQTTEQVTASENKDTSTEQHSEETASERLATLAKEYRTIAANHRKLAELAESEGDIETADKQDALGDKAEEEAENIEEKLSGCAAEEKPEEKSIPEEKADAEENEEAKTNLESRREPGTVVTSSKHKPLKRDDGETVESFGIDKNASLVEENSYCDDPEVELLSKMWRSAPKDEE